METEYYQQLLHEKDLMLEKAAQVIEGLKQDLESIIQQHSKCQEQYDDFVLSCSNWDQQQEIQMLKKLLTQETITFHQEQFKTSNLQFNYKNELEMSLIREQKLKEFLQNTNQYVQNLISLFAKCIEEPIAEGIKQILFEFEIWEKSQEYNKTLQLQIADHQRSNYSYLNQGYKQLQKDLKQLTEDFGVEQYILDLQQLNEQQSLLNNLIKSNNELIQRLNDKIEEQQININKMNTQIEQLNQELNEQKQQNMRLESEISNQINQQEIQKQQMAHQNKQQLEYLHMIDEYEQLLQQRVEIEDYNKVAKLFEQSLIDLEKLQDKYEKKQLELDTVTLKLRDQKIMFNSIVTEIKEQLEQFLQNPCNLISLSKMITQCNKYVSFTKSKNQSKECQIPPKITSTTPKITKLRTFTSDY